MDGISDIQHVGGHVLIQRTSLTHLDVLSGLSSVSGSLYLSTNPGLRDISGLSNLADIGELGIVDNPILTDIDAPAAA